MKKVLGVFLGLSIVLSVPMLVSAYSAEDVLSIKCHVLNYGSLSNDINDDGNTDVLDILQMKHDTFQDYLNMT